MAVTTETLSWIFLSAVLLYLAEHLFWAVGVRRGAHRPEQPALPALDPSAEATVDLSVYPHCTVLVCARDEEHNIERCLESLARLRYPASRLQILIVDDKSTDRTPQILEAWKAKLPNLTVLRTGEEVMHLRGKVNALTQGMDVATGEYVMITDADSQVHPDWVREYLRYYEPDTGMVASVTLLNRKYFLDGVQSIDWSYLLGIALANANLNVPLSVIGNNLSIRRAAYEDVGGYRKIPFSVTEDFALFSAIWHRKPWKVKFPVQEELTVMSEPCPNFRAWWRQKHRWVKGGEGLKLYGYVIFALGLLGQAAMIAAPFVLPLTTALVVIGLKWLADLSISIQILKHTRHRELLAFFPIYEIYLALFIFSMPIMLLQKDVKWKGRVYRQ